MPPFVDVDEPGVACVIDERLIFFASSGGGVVVATILFDFCVVVDEVTVAAAAVFVVVCDADVAAEDGSSNTDSGFTKLNSLLELSELLSLIDAERGVVAVVTVDGVGD